MASRTRNVLELCAGYGGFSLAFRLAGIDVRTVAYVERDAHAAATLVARMEDEALDQAPIWDDLATFPRHVLRGRVDVVCAGFPCQPWSAAGRRGGVDDDRWLWPQIATVVRDVGPQFVFLENVPGLNPPGGGGLSFVLQDLADLGFDAEWGLLSAAAVGAPHKRERFWLLAYAPDSRCEGRRVPGGSFGETLGVVDGPGSGVDSQTVADTCSIGRAERFGSDPQERPGWSDDAPPGSGTWPPGPTDLTGWGSYSGPQPQVRRSIDGVAGRMVKPNGLGDRLHLLGNGLVPQVAAEAFRQLAERAGILGDSNESGLEGFGSSEPGRFAQSA